MNEIAADNEMVNPNRLDDITGGDTELEQELINLFLEDTPQRLAELEHSITTGDAITIQEAAHTLKGSCGNMGAVRMHHLAVDIEASARKGDLKDIQQPVQALAAAFTATRILLLARIGQTGETC